MYLWLKIYGL
jgi:hypothetical protein